MSHSSILNEIDDTARHLTDVLRGIPIGQLDQVPFEGSWTAGETAEHILKSSAFIADVLRGRTAPTDRDPEEKIAVLRGIFLDFTVKYNAPADTLPAEKMHPKEGLIHSLQHSLESIVAAASLLDPHQLCLDMEFPKMGHLTRIELCAFALYHTQRHVRQLKHIAQCLNEPAAAAV